MLPLVAYETSPACISALHLAPAPCFSQGHLGDYGLGFLTSSPHSNALRYSDPRERFALVQQALPQCIDRTVNVLRLPATL